MIVEEWHPNQGRRLTWRQRCDPLAEHAPNRTLTRREGRRVSVVSQFPCPRSGSIVARWGPKSPCSPELQKAEERAEPVADAGLPRKPGISGVSLVPRP